MSRTFLDDELMVWEAFPSGGDFGFPERPYIVFNCMTNRLLRPRVVQVEGDEADAEAVIARASTADLRDLFGRARDLD